MMSSYQASIGFRCPVTPISDWTTKCPIQSGPIVRRKEVEVVVERRLGLIFDDLHDLVDGIEPIRVDER